MATAQRDFVQVPFKGTEDAPLPGWAELVRHVENRVAGAGEPPHQLLGSLEAIIPINERETDNAVAACGSQFDRVTRLGRSVVAPNLGKETLLTHPLVMELVDRATVIAPDAEVELVKVLCESPVVLEPPECGVGQKQVLAALFDQLPQMLDGRGAVRRMITRVLTVTVLWEMPPAASIQLDQLVIAPANHQHRGVTGDCGSHYVADSGDTLAIRRCRNRLKELPRMALVSQCRLEPFLPALEGLQLGFNLCEPLPEFLGFLVSG
jgi:hypothetical protein